MFLRLKNDYHSIVASELIEMVLINNGECFFKVATHKTEFF